MDGPIRNHWGSSRSPWKCVRVLLTPQDGREETQVFGTRSERSLPTSSRPWFRTSGVKRRGSTRENGVGHDRVRALRRTGGSALDYRGPLYALNGIGSGPVRDPLCPGPSDEVDAPRTRPRHEGPQVGPWTPGRVESDRCPGEDSWGRIRDIGISEWIFEGVRGGDPSRVAGGERSDLKSPSDPGPTGRVV